MRVTVVSPGLIPMPTGFGSAIHLWTIIDALLKRGHEVHLLVFAEGDRREDLADPRTCVRAEAVRHLKQCGVKVRHLQFPGGVSPPRRYALRILEKTLTQKVEHYYTSVNHGTVIDEALVEAKAEAVVCWTVEAVAATQACKCRKIPRMGVLTDLDHLARRYRRSMTKPSCLKDKLMALLPSLYDWRHPRAIVSLLEDCEVVYCHAAHHCRWLNDRGVLQAKYLAVPVKDNVGSDWERLRRQALAANALPKVSVIGQTQGVATFWGIRFMAEEVMRLFDDIHKRMPFELHVIGGGKIPEPLAKMIAQPYVKIRGYVDDIAGEFLSSDVFFVPTPITLGFRTRIAEAYSYGCCVVAHRANAAGMPEMESGVNCLLGSDATSLAEGVRVCLADRQLANRLGSEARKVYESKLRGELIGNAMIQALEQVAVAAKKHRQAKASETS